tara:strand:+ start:74 stop:511 length:438 start_codon:yes stop_codon:yes gene_type:complete
LPKKFKFINFIIIIPFLFQNINGQNIQLNEDQLKTILLIYFSDSKMPNLLGHQFFKSKKGTAVQLDIEIVKENLNDTVYLCFETLNKLSKVSNKPFNQLFVIFHFKNNDLPIVINADNNCLNKFFNSTIVDKSDWKNNCLDIGIL